MLAGMIFFCFCPTKCVETKNNKQADHILIVFISVRGAGMDRKFKKVYYDPSGHGAFGGIKQL